MCAGVRGKFGGFVRDLGDHDYEGARIERKGMRGILRCEGVEAVPEVENAIGVSVRLKFEGVVI